MTCSGPRAAAPALHVTRGASWAWLYTVRDARKNPVDLTGAKVWFTVKNRIEDEAAVIAKKNVAAGGVDNQILVDPTQVGVTRGQFTVFGDPADTALLDPAASFWCDAFIQLPGGPPVRRYQVQKNQQLIVDPAVTTSF